MTKPKFIVDAMLGDLARWLRLLGYDTTYARNLPDPLIVRKAIEEDRIIVTRDVGLYTLARRRGAKVILLKPGDLVDALAQLAEEAGVQLEAEPSRSRCPHCNAPLREAKPREVAHKVPQGVLERHTRFWVCTRCGQVYWMGGHWRGIRSTLEEAKRRLEERRARRSRASPQPPREGAQPR